MMEVLALVVPMYILQQVSLDETETTLFNDCDPLSFHAGSVARFPDFAKLSAMPYDVTSYEMQKITDESAKYSVDIASYEKNEWDAMLAPWESSAAFSYSATTFAQRLAQQEGWKGLQSVESTRKLASM